MNFFFLIDVSGHCWHESFGTNDRTSPLFLLVGFSNLYDRRFENETYFGDRGSLTPRLEGCFSRLFFESCFLLDVDL